MQTKEHTEIQMVGLVLSSKHTVITKKMHSKAYYFTKVKMPVTAYQKLKAVRWKSEAWSQFIKLFSAKQCAFCLRFITQRALSWVQLTDTHAHKYKSVELVQSNIHNRIYLQSPSFDTYIIKTGRTHTFTILFIVSH